MKRLLATAFLIYSFGLAAQTQNDNPLRSGFGISVTIGGDFLVTGTFAALPNEKLDQFITRIYNEARQNYLSILPQEKELLEKMIKNTEVPLRNIRLVRADKSEKIIDLLKFRNTGDLTLNPYLRNEDVIIFPPLDIDRNFFFITGAVNKPGTYQFVDGDKLSDAIAIALGINKAYDDVQTAEISRLDFSGNNEQVFSVKLSDDFLLKRGDRIRVGGEETGRKNFKAYIAGEVVNEGEFPVSRNSTTLFDVLQKAKLKPNADLSQIRIVKAELLPPLFLLREYGIKEKEEVREYITSALKFYRDYEFISLYRMSDLDEVDTTFFGMDVRFRSLLSGTLIDLRSDMNKAKEVLVRDGDYVVVPEKDKYVHLIGYIKQNGVQVYQPGKDYNYYIEQAGGYGEYAIKDDVRIIKGATKEWVNPTETNVVIEPGDYIYIPRELNYSFNYYLGRFGTYLSIVGNAATIILLLIQFGK